MVSDPSVRIVVIGTGYVGLVTGACLAEIGHQVVCVDKDSAKISKLENGEIPIYEPGLEEIVGKNTATGRLKFSQDINLENIDAVFLAVGTPTDPKTGNADMSMFYAAAEEVKKNQQDSLTVISKSTVPVGTGRKLKEIFGDSARIVSNPEFLREGSAVSDFMKPDRVVVGSNSKEAKELLDKIYAPLNAEIFHTSVETSELIKYASNSFLATKLAFINEMAELCEIVGADVSDLADGMGLDKRIGRQFLNAGPGIGGSCFPKDIRSLKAQFSEFGTKTLVVEGVIESNEARIKSLAGKISKYIGSGKVAVFGLTFKANTDDVRESAAVQIAYLLADARIEVQAYDPKAYTSSLDNKINICSSAGEAANGAEAIVILTEWQEFAELDYSSLSLNKKVIFDLRNILSDNIPSGFEYYSVGKNMPKF